MLSSGATELPVNEQATFDATTEPAPAHVLVTRDAANDEIAGTAKQTGGSGAVGPIFISLT